MAKKLIPASKSCEEIRRLIGAFEHNQHVGTVYDPHDTHALYGTQAFEADDYAKRLKELGSVSSVRIRLSSRSSASLCLLSLMSWLQCEAIIGALVAFS